MDKLLTVKEAAELLGVCGARVRQLCMGMTAKNGRYYYPPAFEIGKDFHVIGGSRNKIYLSERSLKNYLEIL